MENAEIDPGLGTLRARGHSGQVLTPVVPVDLKADGGPIASQMLVGWIGQREIQGSARGRLRGFGRKTVTGDDGLPEVCRCYTRAQRIGLWG
jgi:hypothetical protein